MTEDDHGERRRLGAVVLAVLISQGTLVPRGSEPGGRARGARGYRRRDVVPRRGVRCVRYFRGRLGRRERARSTGTADRRRRARRRGLVHRARRRSPRVRIRLPGGARGPGRRRRAHHRRLLAGDHFADGPPAAGGRATWEPPGSLSGLARRSARSSAVRSPT